MIGKIWDKAQVVFPEYGNPTVQISLFVE